MSVNTSQTDFGGDTIISLDYTGIHPEIGRHAAELLGSGLRSYKQFGGYASPDGRGTIAIIGKGPMNENDTAVFECVRNLLENPPDRFDLRPKVNVRRLGKTCYADVVVGPGQQEEMAERIYAQLNAAMPQGIGPLRKGRCYHNPLVDGMWLEGEKEWLLWSEPDVNDGPLFRLQAVQLSFDTSRPREMTVLSHLLDEMTMRSVITDLVQ